MTNVRGFQMNTNRLTALMVIVLALGLVASVHAAPIPIRIDEVRVDDFVLQPNEVNRLDIQRGQEIPIDIKLTALNDTDNVEVEAFISGFEFNDIEPVHDAVRIFDADANVSYIKRLSLRISDDVDEDDYKLRVIISDRNSDQIIQTYSLKIDLPRHSIRLEDVILTPGDAVVAGKALLAVVRLENKGEKREDDVRVTISIPELGVQGSDYIDELRVNDEEETEEIFLKIPDNAKPGRYLVNIDVEYEQLHDRLTASKSIDVIANPLFGSGGVIDGVVNDAPKAVITVGTAFASATGEHGAIFPITIQNNFPVSKVVAIQVAGAQDVGEVAIYPSSTMVINGNDVRVFQVEVVPFGDVLPGTYVVTAHINVGETIQKDIPLTVRVEQSDGWMWNTNGSGWSLKGLLEGLLVAAVIVLVIIGLVVAFSRSRATKETKETTSNMQTYY